MDILYAIGAVALFILLIDRLVDIPWWAQLPLCILVAFGMNQDWRALALETFAGVALSTIHAAALHYIQRPKGVAASNRNTIPVVW